MRFSAELNADLLRYFFGSHEPKFLLSSALSIPSPEELARKNIDADLIGLTAMHSKQIAGFFHDTLIPQRRDQQFVTPDDGRKFTELYNVQHLQSAQLDRVSRVCISTIQRLYSMLRDEEIDERSGYELRESLWKQPPPVVYNPNVPIETFDFIITDECHRSIYNLWRQVLEYFEAYLVGLPPRLRSRPSAFSIRTSSWNTATSATSQF